MRSTIHSAGHPQRCSSEKSWPNKVEHVCARRGAQRWHTFSFLHGHLGGPHHTIVGHTGARSQINCEMNSNHEQVKLAKIDENIGTPVALREGTHLRYRPCHGTAKKKILCHNSRITAIVVSIAACELSSSVPQSRNRALHTLHMTLLNCLNVPSTCISKPALILSTDVCPLHFQKYLEFLQVYQSLS